jgi:WD40 repeat protein
MDHERLMRDFGSHAFVPVSSIDFSNDGHIISSGHTQVHIWNNNGTKLRRQSTGTPRSNAIAFSSDGEQYAYPSENDGRNDTISINIVHTDSGNLLSSLKSSDYAVESLVFTPDGKYLLARYDDGKIIHWDWKNSTASSIIYTSDDLKNFDFSDDASTCAGLSEMGLVTVWNTTTGDVVDRFYSYLSLTSRSSSISSRATDLDLSSDGKYLAGSMNSELTIWDISSGKKILDVSMLSEIIRINDIEFSPDTRYLAASARLSTNDKYYFSREEFWNAINASVDSDLLLHSLGGENVVYLWDFEKLKDGDY